LELNSRKSSKFHRKTNNAILSNSSKVT
jgi:hypothetical protein